MNYREVIRKEKNGDYKGLNMEEELITLITRIKVLEKVYKTALKYSLESHEYRSEMHKALKEAEE